MAADSTTSSPAEPRKRSQAPSAAKVEELRLELLSLAGEKLAGGRSRAHEAVLNPVPADAGPNYRRGVLLFVERFRRNLRLKTPEQAAAKQGVATVARATKKAPEQPTLQQRADQLIARYHRQLEEIVPARDIQMLLKMAGIIKGIPRIDYSEAINCVERHVRRYEEEQAKLAASVAPPEVPAPVIPVQRRPEVRPRGKLSRGRHIVEPPAVQSVAAPAA